MSAGEDPRRSVPTLPQGAAGRDGQRVCLRSLALGDTRELHLAYADSEVLRFWLSPQHANVAQTEQLIVGDAAAAQAGEQLAWAIVERASASVVGRVTLAMDDVHGRGTVGFLLARQAWGRGLASSALRLVLQHAFAELTLRRVEAFVDPRNAPSTRLLEHLGFSREGLLRQRWLVDGEVRDDWARLPRSAGPVGRGNGRAARASSSATLGGQFLPALRRPVKAA